MEGEVRQDDLPGIGRRYRIGCADGGVMTVVVHDSGRRDVYVSASADAEPAVVSMDDHDAKTVAQVVGGEYEASSALDEVAEVLGELAIEWAVLTPGSPGTGRSIEDLHIRSATGINVMAIIRDHATIHGPRDGEVLEAGDRLIVAGRHSSMPAFRRLVVGT